MHKSKITESISLIWKWNWNAFLCVDIFCQSNVIIELLSRYTQFLSVVMIKWIFCWLLQEVASKCQVTIFFLLYNHWTRNKLRCNSMKVQFFYQTVIIRPYWDANIFWQSSEDLHIPDHWFYECGHHQLKSFLIEGNLQLIDDHSWNVYTICNITYD